MAKVKVKKIEEPKPFMGLLTGVMNEVDFTPHKTLDKIKAPKKNRPVFKLRPMTNAERHQIEADNSSIKAKGLLWAQKEGISLQELSEIDSGDNKAGYLAMIEKFDSFADYGLRDEIVRKCIVGGEDLKLDKNGGMDKKVFNSLHPDLIAEFRDEIFRISNLSLGDVLGL